MSRHARSCLACPDRARPRPLPAAAPARERRLRIGLARARHPARRRGRAQDRAARGQGGNARRARGGGGGEAPASHCQRALGFASDAENVYIAYEYVAGQTLRSALRAGALDDHAAVEAARQIADALAHAHREGVVHRDVKPANVLLADGDGVDARLLDFGLAQLAEAETLTAVGDVPGTLAYISPERLANEPAGPAADVWAVGVLLWEALAGWHPFWAGSLLDTARKISAGAPPLRTQRPDLPKLLLAAVDRSLEVDPKRRPSAAQLGHALAQAFAERDERKAERTARPAVRVKRHMPLPKMVAPALAGLAAGWTVHTLPFYPGPAALVATALATALTAWAPRLGLAFTLALPLLPIGNFSIAAALVAAVAAVALLAVSWHEPRSGLAFAAGPFLGPLGLLGLAPLLFQPIRNPFRRATQTALAVLSAGLVAGMGHAALPFTGARPELGLGIAGSAEPGAVLTALLDALGRHQELPLEAAVLAAAAVLLPTIRRLGHWGIAISCAVLLGATLLPVPGVHPLGLVLSAWVTAAFLYRGAPASPELLLPKLLRVTRTAPRAAA